MLGDWTRLLTYRADSIIHIFWITFYARLYPLFVRFTNEFIYLLIYLFIHLYIYLFVLLDFYQLPPCVSGFQVTTGKIFCGGEAAVQYFVVCRYIYSFILGIVFVFQVFQRPSRLTNTEH